MPLRRAFTLVETLLMMAALLVFSITLAAALRKDWPLLTGQAVPAPDSTPKSGPAAAAEMPAPVAKPEPTAEKKNAEPEGAKAGSPATAPKP